ncbi:MAG: hypothetical protein IPG92_18110 [Flavobacteriales bacterium]|nr:hypothetical protein [Flavobacteriales bacterium]
MRLSIFARMFRCALTGIALLFSVGVCAQALHRKQLITSLGAGPGLVTVDHTTDTITTSNTTAGSMTLRFAYALSDRWSIGVHYDRIGTDRAGKATELLRFTTYLLEERTDRGSDRAALEVNLAVGPTLMTLKPFSQNLPLRGRSNAVNIGVRYLHRFGSTLGAFVAVDHAAAANMAVTDYNGDAITDAKGEPITLDWNSQRVNVGLGVVF